MPVFEIPTGPSQRRFSIPLGDKTYNLRLDYADAPEGGWLLDIADAQNNLIVCGIPLVTGADLLAQYAYLGIGGKLFVTTDGDLGAVPTYSNLGVSSHLWWEPN